MAEGERLVEEGEHVGGREIDAGLVALKAQDLVGVDGERNRVENAERVHLDHVRRRRTTSAMRLMCSGSEPQQAPTILQPASSNAG